MNIRHVLFVQDKIYPENDFNDFSEKILTIKVLFKYILNYSNEKNSCTGAIVLFTDFFIIALSYKIV